MTIADDPALDQSAIVVLVPEAEAAVRSWRVELDPSAALGVPAHITLLYPFAAPRDITDDVIAKLAETVGGFGAFDYQLDATRWFDNTVVWLAPNPAAPFISLTRTLVQAFPEFPRYGGAFGDDVVPHLTVGDRGPLQRLEEAASTVTRLLPIRARTQDVALLIGGRSPGSWRVDRTVPLA